MSKPWSFRKAGPDEHAVVTSTWIHSNYRLSPRCRHLAKGVYFDNHSPIVHHTLKECGAVVAFASEVPDEIIGWVCFERHEGELLVHYIYVKGDYRRAGVGKSLLAHIGWTKDQRIWATHITAPYEKWKLDRRGYQIRNNPYLQRRPNVV